MSTSDTFDAFIELSVALTAFDRVTLFGTGQAQDYFDAVSSIVGEQRMDAIAAIWRSIIADTIDPAYGAALRDAVSRGVEAIAYRLEFDANRVFTGPRIPIEL